MAGKEGICIAHSDKIWSNAGEQSFEPSAGQAAQVSAQSSRGGVFLRGHDRTKHPDGHETEKTSSESSCWSAGQWMRKNMMLPGLRLEISFIKPPRLLPQTTAIKTCLLLEINTNIKYFYRNVFIIMITYFMSFHKS